MSEHKKCPFCGGKPQYDNSDYGPYEWIICEECGAHGPQINYNRASLGDAWTFWDARAPSHPLSPSSSPDIAGHNRTLSE